MTVYADTSFFVSVYVQDRHSKTADRMLSAPMNLWLSTLHLAEWAHAISQQVFRKEMSAAEADQVMHKFEEDRVAGVWVGVTVPESAFDLCADLARRYGAKLGVRTLDSLHVACALELRAERFWTFDDRQLKLARAVGLRTR